MSPHGRRWLRRIPGLTSSSRFLASYGIGGIEPVLVYQMAKVGSSSVVQALQEQGLVTFHVHRMSADHLQRMRAQRAALGWKIAPIPAHDRLGLRLRRWIADRRRPAKIVTLVRDPIARNLSSYFEHLDFIWNRTNAHESVPLPDLHRGFFERFPHEEPLTWFEDELQPVFGIDVYRLPFPATGVLRDGDLLLLKSELDDNAKARALAELTGRAALTLRPANETARKTKGEVYRQFLDTIRFEASFVDRMLGARYTRHFYSDAERKTMRRKYLRG